MKIKIDRYTLLVNVCRFLLAATFLCSGFFKLNDPLGFMYKVEEYGRVFGCAPLLSYPVSLVLSVGMGMMEFCMGAYLLFGIYRLLVSRLMLLFMLFFTPLTLYLALTDTVPDCGCFGEVWVLTNWQSFGKNVILLAASFVIAVGGRRIFRLGLERSNWILSVYMWIFVVIYVTYSLYMLPPVDFGPYHVDADLRRYLTQDVVEHAQFETYFTLEKDGVRKEFTLDDYPDTTWTFIDSRTELLSGGESLPYVAPLEMIPVNEGNGSDMAQEMLEQPGYKFLLVAPYLEYADEGIMDRIALLHDYCSSYGFPLYCLTSSTVEHIERWTEYTAAEYPFYHADATLLKTIVRSSPGLVLLEGSRIKMKWSSFSFPGEQELSEPMDAFVRSLPQERSLTHDLTNVLLWFFLPLFVWIMLDGMWMAIRREKKESETNNINSLIKKTMRKKIVAGNWKMNKNLQEGLELASELKNVLAAEKPNCEVIIGTPFIHLAKACELLQDSVVAVSAENCADKASGAYTGEVSAEMVKSTGAEYVILGHSERREYYHETPEILKEKVDLALANGLKVIFCIGESLAQREAGEQEAVCKAELAGSVFHLTAEQWKNVVIAYEPIWAIGTGKTATAEQAEEIHAFIRSCVAEVYGAEVAEETSILYGGSCKASNAPELFAKPDIDGGLIGGASLKVADFKGIIDAWN